MTEEVLSVTHHSYAFLGLGSHSRNVALLSWALVLFSLAGCGSDGDGASYGNGKTAEIGESAQQALTVTNGGMVQLDSGAARVQIPAGAMTEDAIVSIEAVDPASLPGRELLASSAFDFKVDDAGAIFTSPVTLTMRIDEAAMPEGAKAAISWLNEGSWEKLPQSVREGDMISVQTDHFSTFAVTFEVIDGHLRQTGGMCDATSFSACGGNPVGVWTIDASCIDVSNDQAIGGGAEACEGLSVNATVDYDGTVTIETDGSYVANLKAGASTEVTYPKSCLGGITDCAMLDPGAADAGDACLISQTSNEDVLEQGTWNASGNTLTLTDAAGEQSMAEFCVSGNTLRLSVVEGDEDASDINIVMVMTRD